MLQPALQVPPQTVIASETPDQGADGHSFGPDLDRAVAIFVGERTRLMRIAHGIVGNVAAAEDVVQETWLRWQRSNRREINNPAAFLATATKHLAINVIQSAGHRHEAATNSRLTDLVDRSQDPQKQAEQTAAVEWALGELMARLTPAQRAAYLLRNGFEYPYRDIANLLGTSVENARQLAHRAQRNLVAGRIGRVDPAAHRRLVRTFVAAAQTRNLADLEQLLAHGARPALRCALTKASTGVTQSPGVRSYS